MSGHLKETAIRTGIALISELQGLSRENMPTSSIIIKVRKQLNEDLKELKDQPQETQA